VWDHPPVSLLLADRAVLLTGASSGIGAATAVALAAKGARLGLVARREDRLGQVADACVAAGSPEVYLWTTDLSDLRAAEAVARTADARLGGLDVLVNNAGTPKRKAVQELRVDEVEHTMAVNYLAPVRMVLAVLPGMVQRGRGSIVNVSSLGGRLGIRGEAAYSASKFALCGFTESMLADLHGTGVDVRLVLPGAIATEIWDQPDNDPPFYDGPLEPPETVADAIVEAIEGDRVETYVPDMRAVVEMKTADLQGFSESMVAATDEMGGGPEGSDR
jgi:short-subunit dehydrogenase